jgi:hypothetical protein
MSQQRKEGRWAVFSTTPTAEAIGFRCIGLCALALLAATRPAIAVDPRQPAADYLRQMFTTDDGLPSNIVNDVLQTQDGFLIVDRRTACFASMDTALPRSTRIRRSKSSFIHWRKGLTATSGLQPGTAFTRFHTQRSLREGRLYRCITWGKAQLIP